MNTYKYEGPVTMFGATVIDLFVATTTASTKAKALSNLAYRAKKDLGLAPTAKIELGEQYLVKE